MIKSTCECYYDAALHKQSTNCPTHDPYRRCENLEAHIDQLESEIAELRKDRERLDGLFKKRECWELRTLPNGYRLTVFQMIHSLGSWTCVGAYESKTPREAIDAAITAAEETEAVDPPE